MTTATLQATDLRTLAARISTQHTSLCDATAALQNATGADATTCIAAIKAARAEQQAAAIEQRSRSLFDVDRNALAELADIAAALYATGRRTDIAVVARELRIADRDLRGWQLPGATYINAARAALRRARTA